MQNIAQQDYLPKLYPSCILPLTENSLSFNLDLLFPQGVEYPTPFCKPLWETLEKGNKSYPRAKKLLISCTRKSLSPNSNFHGINHYKLHL